MTLQATAHGPAERPAPKTRSAFRHFEPLGTRWMDNDVYGHLNNVVYYSLFDTAVNGYLVKRGALDIESGEVIGLVVQSHCNYFRPLAFPQALDAGLRVVQIGISSVRYEIGMFRAGEELASAGGEFVHVYVDRASRRPLALPASLRAAVEALQ